MFIDLGTKQLSAVRSTEPGAVATAFMVRYSFGSLKAVATAPGSVL